MTSLHPSHPRWPGIGLAALGMGLIGLALAGSRLGLGDSSGNISPAEVAAGASGALAGLCGAILMFQPADDERLPLPYLRETIPRLLDAAGETVTAESAAPGIMLGILLAAAFLRLHRLTFQSLWLDELMTWWRSSSPDVSAVLRSVESDVWPPGYSLFIYGIIRLAGINDFLLRFPAALAGVMSVAALYRLGRSLGGHLAGMGGALLLAVLEVGIYYSQEARPYSGLILFSILSTHFLLRCVRRLAGGEKMQLLDAAGVVVFTLLAMYWNYYGLVLAALQGVAAGLRLIARPKTWPALIGLYAAVALGYVPWLLPTLADLGRESYLPTRPGGYVDELMAFLRFLFNLQHVYTLAAVGLVIAALIAEAVRQRQGRRVAWGVWLLLLGWLLAPFTITYVRSLVSVSTFLFRYLLISLPAAALLPALALARLPLRRWMQAGMLALAALILVNNLARHWDYYTRPTKADFRDAAYEVARRDASLGSPTLIAGFTGYSGTEQLFDFYLAQAGSPRRVQIGAGFEGDLPAVEQAVAAHGARYVWLIAAQNDPAPGFLEALQQRYTLVDHHAYPAEQGPAGTWLFAVR